MVNSNGVTFGQSVPGCLGSIKPGLPLRSIHHATCESVLPMMLKRFELAREFTAWLPACSINKLENEELPGAERLWKLVFATLEPHRMELQLRQAFDDSTNSRCNCFCCRPFPSIRAPGGLQ